MKIFVPTFERLRRARRTRRSASVSSAASRLRPAPDEPAVTDLVIIKHPQQQLIVRLQPAAVEVSRVQQLGPRLVGLLDDHRPAMLLLDLQAIGQLSSECLSQLIHANGHARSQGLRLVLMNLCDPLREVFRITRLDRLFELIDRDSPASD